MKIEVYPDDDVVARKAAAVIAGDVRAAVAARGRFIMAVSGGHTPWLMMRALADEALPWEHVHVVQVDERVAPAGDPDRNLTHLRASLLDTPLPARSYPCHAGRGSGPRSRGGAIRRNTAGRGGLAAGA